MRHKKTPPLRERLLSRLIIDPSGCVLWAGSVNSSGYGVIKEQGRQSYVHRLVYELFAGPVPEGLQLDHLCRVRHCASPAHLEPVTCRENVLRGTSLQARNAAKTHCDHGHEFTPENTQRRAAGRQCKECQRQSRKAASSQVAVR